MASIKQELKQNLIYFKQANKGTICKHKTVFGWANIAIANGFTEVIGGEFFDPENIEKELAGEVIIDGHASTVKTCLASSSEQSLSRSRVLNKFEERPLEGAKILTLYEYDCIVFLLWPNYNLAICKISLTPILE